MRQWTRISFITLKTRSNPYLIEAGASILAYFVTEDSPNKFPALPVREGENVFVWFAGFQIRMHMNIMSLDLPKSKLWKEEISKSSETTISKENLNY